MAKRNKVTWIANKNHDEFHRVEEGVPQPEGCQLGEILPDNRIEFRSAREAMSKRPGRKAYDPCAYCTKKFRSRH